MVSFSPKTEEIVIVREDSPVISHVLRDPDTKDPVDITGYSFEFVVDTREEPDDVSTELFRITATITDGLGGAFEYQPSSLQTTQVRSTYFYRLIMTTTVPSVRTVLKGSFVVV